jgi:hypothetical protein
MFLYMESNTNKRLIQYDVSTMNGIQEIRVSTSRNRPFKTISFEHISRYKSLGAVQLTSGLKVTEQHVLCRPGVTDNVTVGNEVAL